MAAQRLLERALKGGQSKALQIRFFQVTFGRRFWMEYSSSNQWPSGAYGAAIELCDLESDYTQATNWNLAQGIVNSIVNNTLPRGSPGRTNEAICQERDYKDLVINEILYEQPGWDPDFQYLCI